MAPSHVDLSVLWVPIMPETSKLGEAMEQVGKDATESFGKGSSSLGDKIHESVTKSKDKIKDVFHRTGSDASKSMSDAFKEESKAVEDIAADAGEKASHKFRDTAKNLSKLLVDSVGPDTKKLLGDRLEETVGGALEGVLGSRSKLGGQLAHSAFDFGFDELKNKLGSVKDTVTDTKKAFADLTGGKTATGVAGLVDGFEKLEKHAKDFGIDVGTLPDPIQDVVNKTTDAANAAQDFADIFKGMPGIVGKVGSALELLAPEIAVLATGAEAVWNGLPGIGGGLKEILAAPDPTKGFQSPIQGPAGIPTTGPVTLPPSLGGNTAGVVPPGYQAAPGSLDPFAGLLPPGMAAPDLSKAPAIAPPDMPDGAVPHAFVNVPPRPPAGNTVPLIQKPDGTWTSSNPAWAHLIQRESSGDPGIYNHTDSNAQAGDPSQGLFQFTRSTWAAHGGLKYGRDPSKATPQQQAEIAANLIQANPSGSDWGAGLPGRESASGLLSGVGPGGATSSGWWGSRSTDTSDSAPMPTSRGGGTSGDKVPVGTQQDPLFVSAVGKNGGAGTGGSEAGSEGQQLGQGLFDGLLQETGLDGSVFKTFSGASNPMDFGITKLGTGLLNWAGGMANAHSQKGQAQPAQASTYNVDQSFNLTQHGVQGNGMDAYKAGMNSSNRTEALASSLPGQ